MIMKGIYQVLQIALLQGLFLLPVSAQTSNKPMAEMSWQELNEQWESLAVKGKNTEALPFARAALEKARRDASEASLDYGTSLDLLGYSLHHTGQYAEAERSFLAAVEHARIYLGESHEDYITRLSNLAMLHMDMGELAQSVTELESAVHLSEKHLAKDNPYAIIMVNNLGLAYEKIGNLDLALNYYLQALDLTEQTQGTASARYANRLCNIAAVYRKTGKFEQALDFNLRALAIYEKTIEKSRSEYINGLNGVMGSYITLFRFEEALPVSEQLLAWMKERPGKETLDMYNYCAGITNLYFQSGQYLRCAAFSKETLAKYREIFPRQYAEHAYVARFAMISYEKLGNLQEAANYALLVNRFSLEELQENFSKFSEDEQLQKYHAYREWTDLSSLLFAVQHPEFPELTAAAYDYQLNIKGLSLANRRELFQSIRKNPDTQLASQFEEWQRLQNNISKQYALPPARRQTNLDSLLVRSSELERRLVAGSDPFRLASQAVSWHEVEAALLPGEAAVEFSVINGARSGGSQYIAWVLRSGDTAPKQVALFEEKEIGDLAATRRLFAYTHSPEGKNLRELLWQPLEPLLKGISTLYFAPAGVLHQVNLGAVPVSASDVVADRFKLHRLVSTRQVLSLDKAQDRIIPKSALVFGGIRYETDSVALSNTNISVHDTLPAIFDGQSRGSSQGNEWDFLSGSLKEAMTVRSQLEKAGAKVTFGEGFHASEGFFKRTVQVSPSPSVLHLATHGFFLTTPDSTASSGFSTAENPMVRAGLVLSGANRAWSSGTPLAGQEDGILTALEISRLDLSGTELAVLSACGTGQGKVEAGEGVLGLQRAFKMAGVHYVIMTLWNVQDHDAQQFMGFFYEEWLTQKKTIPDAFRVAQRKMRLLHTQPFQPTAWAGFVLLE